uniref:Delta(3)-Delta(2)-enoyl-CoA isomerase n=1 Tax=Picea sitchensis TaxID=3332 RepID=A9NYU1_PICSI|nr:unknown [Picea sitchensis]
MCNLEKRGRVYILTLLGDGDHRFNPSTIDAISAALKEVQDSPDAGALVTTNQGRYFSNGLDLQWISQNPDAHLSTIRIKFENLLASFIRLRVPTIAAICGHAAAGGFIVALAHDYRFMRGDRSVLYMSELDIGMKLPRSLMAVIRSKLLPGTLRDVVLGARKFSAQMALEGGIVDSVYADSPQTLEAAVSEAQKLAGRGWKKEIYSELRLGAFPGVLEELDAHRDPYLFPVSSKL